MYGTKSENKCGKSNLVYGGHSIWANIFKFYRLSRFVSNIRVKLRVFQFQIQIQPDEFEIHNCGTEESESVKKKKKVEKL